jgi:hypothetical protein
MNIRRLLLLIRSRLIENRRRNGFYLLTLFLVLLLVVFLWLVSAGSSLVYTYVSPQNGETLRVGSDSWYQAQTMLWYLFLFFSGGLFAASSFVNFGNPGEGILYLLRPASRAEKWGSESIIHLLLFPLVFALTFFLVMGPATALVNRKSEKELMVLLNGRTQIALASEETAIRNGVAPRPMLVTPVRVPSELFLPWKFEPGVADPTALKPFALVHILALAFFSFFMLGSLVFNRFAIFKTFIAGFVIFVAGIVVQLQLDGLAIPSGWSQSFLSPSAFFASSETGPSLSADLPEWYTGWIYLLLAILLLVWLQTLLRMALNRKTA